MMTIKIFAILCLCVAVGSTCDITGLKTCLQALTQQMGTEIQNMVTDSMAAAMNSSGMGSINMTSMEQLAMNSVDVICNQEAAVKAAVTCLQSWVSASCSEYSAYLKFINTNGIVGAYKRVCAKNSGNGYVFFSKPAVQCLEAKGAAFGKCAMSTLQGMISQLNQTTMDSACTMYDQISGCSSELDKVTQNSTSCGLAQHVQDIILEFKPTACSGCTLFVSILLMVGAVLLNRITG